MMPLQRYKMQIMYSSIPSTWGMLQASDGGYYKVEDADAAFADMQIDLANTKRALDQCLTDSAERFLEAEALKQLNPTATQES